VKLGSAAECQGISNPGDYTLGVANRSSRGSSESHLALVLGSIVSLSLVLDGGCSADCACTQAGLFRCVGSQSIQACDGCDWKESTCDDRCKLEKGSTWEMDPAKGCKQDSSGGGEVCWCKEQGASSKCSLTWTFTDTCKNSNSPKVAFYDLKENVHWGAYTVSTDGTPLSTTLSCTCGNKICYGAWQANTFWGCAESCQKACTDCCTTCKDGTTSTSLNC
jgi:hypothetical protein